MKLELREIKKGQVLVKRALSGAALNPGGLEQYQVGDTASLDLVVRKDGTKYRLVGRVDGKLGVECSRCLDCFQLVVGVDIDLLYLPLSENRGAGDIRIEEPDLRTAYYRDDQIDLGQLVMEQFQLALPMKPLCRDECQGLCALCGGNRNAEACQCAEVWQDPRLTGLKRLLEQ